MNTYEIIRFIPMFSDTPVEYVLKTEEDDNSQKLFLVEETKDFFSTEGCCGQYCIKYFEGARTEFDNPALKEKLTDLLSRRDIQRQLGDMNRLNNEYKAFIGNIMNEIRSR